MNELQGHTPHLTQNEVGSGDKTSKEGTSPSHNQNEKNLEETPRVRVSSAFSGSLHAQQNERGDKDSTVDDFTVSKKSSEPSSKANLPETNAHQQERSKKEEEGDQGDPQSFAEAQAIEDSKTDTTGNKSTASLVLALEALTVEDCKRILSQSLQDPIHALTNLWDQDSKERLSLAAQKIDELTDKVKTKLNQFTSLSEFRDFVKKQHSDPSDKLLALSLKEISERFLGKSKKVIRGYNTQAQDQKLERLFSILQSEDHRLQHLQANVINDTLNKYISSLLVTELGSDKLNYRLEAAIKFTRIQRQNPLERWTQNLVKKLDGDKKITEEAISFRETTKTNLDRFKKKIKHLITDFSGIFLKGFLSLLSNINQKLSDDISKKEPIGDFVRTNNLAKAT